MKYIVNRDLTVRNIAGETFIMDRNNGIVHSFNPCGIFIWRNITDEKPFEEIVQAVEQEYDVTRENAEEDVFQFILHLEKSGLVSIAEQ